MTTHSRLSPSKRARWSACPGSIRMCEGIPDKSGSAADDGTKTHYVLEMCIKSGESPEAGKIYNHEKLGSFILEEDRRERVNFTLDYIRTRIAELGGLLDVKVTAETYFDNSMIFGRDDLNGTADVILESADTIELIDLKDGMTPVSAENNKQAELYAIGAVYNSQSETIKNVRLTIIQPKMRFNGESGISTWDVPVSYISSLIPVIIAEAEATDKDDAPCIAGEEQCRWCPAKGGCMSVHNKVSEAIGVSFQSLDLPREVATINPEMVDDDKLADMVQALPLLRQLADVVEIEALRRFELGHSIKGLKVIRGRGSKTWAKSDEEILKRLASLKIPKDLRTSSKPITATQALNIKWTDNKGESHTLTERQLKILKDDYISFNEGKPKVVSENAPGKAITLDVSAAFEPVVQELEIPDWMKM